MLDLPRNFNAVVQLLTLVLPLVAIAVSCCALTVAVLNYRRKSAARVRGTYSIGMGRSSEDSYVTSVTLENLKDRAITVFGIYLRLGRNHYIEIEEFEEAPLIIRAFETWYKEYERIDFYSFNAQKLDMNDLLRSREVKQQLVLSTGDGKHVVKEFHRPWEPVMDYFYKNPLIRPVGAVRLYHRKRAWVEAYGSLSRLLTKMESS